MVRPEIDPFDPIPALRTPEKFDAYLNFIVRYVADGPDSELYKELHRNLGAIALSDELAAKASQKAEFTDEQVAQTIEVLSAIDDDANAAEAFSLIKVRSPAILEAGWQRLQRTGPGGEADLQIDSKYRYARIGRDIGVKFFRMGDSDKATEVMKWVATWNTRVAAQGAEDIEADEEGQHKEALNWALEFMKWLTERVPDPRFKRSLKRMHRRAEIFGL